MKFRLFVLTTFEIDILGEEVKLGNIHRINVQYNNCVNVNSLNCVQKHVIYIGTGFQKQYY